jgi:hypothetical protein
MTETTIDVDALANEIRRLGGTSVLGCGALAEALMPFLASHTVDTREAVAWRWRIDAQAEWNVTDNKAIADYAVIQGNEVEPLGRVSEPDDGFVARDFIDTASQLRSGHNVIRQAAVNDHLDVILAALDRQTGVL